MKKSIALLFSCCAMLLLAGLPNPGQTSDCGGFVGKLCPADQYCNFGVGTCNVADALGTCAPKPKACKKVSNPVCGCDGKTYGNACEAAMAGISVNHKGKCIQPEGALCGSRGMAPCPQGQYCDFSVEAQCGMLDGPGTCKEKPKACQEIYKPVCGCDGKTYGNACEAASVGVSVKLQGQCAPAICGGIANIQCPKGQICVDDPRDSCDPAKGGRDCSGICSSK